MWAACGSDRCTDARLHLPEGAQLDAAAAAGVGDLAGPVDRFVEVGAFEDEHAAELLAGLGERSVGGDGLTVLDADGGGGRTWLQTVAELEHASVPDGLIEGAPVFVDLLGFGALGVRLLGFDSVDEGGVLGHVFSPDVW